MCGGRRLVWISIGIFYCRVYGLFHVRCAGELTVQITLRANCKTHPAVLGERVQHVVQESDTGADGDLLGRGELGRMAGFLGWHNAFLGGFGFFGVCWGGEVG